MNFDLSEEQTMLQDAVRRFVQEEYDFESRTKFVANDLGFEEKNWQTFAELGWLSVPFSEQYGGFGGGATDTMVLTEQLGQGLVAEPFLQSVILFGGLLQASAAPQAGEILPELIAGKVHGCFAFNERQSHFALNDVLCRAEQQESGYTLNGEKTVVSNAMAAHYIVVSGRTSGEQFDADGVSLFLVPSDAKGLSRNEYRTMDGQVVANISFDNVSLEQGALLGEMGKGLALIEKVQQLGIVALASEAQGIMDYLLLTTVEYCKQREQFGVPLSSFQALQHRMVEMLSSSEKHRSLLYRAVCSIDEDELNHDAADIQRNLLALKVMLGRAGEHIGAEAIQLHGGMGITDELSIGHYVKRLMTLNTFFGDADWHQQKFIAL